MAVPIPRWWSWRIAHLRSPLLCKSVVSSTRTLAVELVQMHPSEKVIVSLAYVDEARGWAVALEDQTARQEGLTVAAARPIVAREVGVAPGTLENLRKGRLKGLAKHVYDALQAATVRRLQNQLRRLLHEQHLLTQQGEDPRSNDAQAVLADIEAVRKALGLAP